MLKNLGEDLVEIVLNVIMIVETGAALFNKIKSLLTKIVEVIKNPAATLEEIQALLKNGAKDLKAAKEDLMKSWDEAVVSGRSRRLGQKLLSKDLSIIENFLNDIGFGLQLGPEKGVFEIEGFFDAAGNVSRMPERAQAIFIYTAKDAKMVLREGSTMYEFFHELMHARQAKELGLGNYFKLGGYGTAGELAKEKHVFNKIIEYKDFFTKQELKHSLKYLNEDVYFRNGANPIELNFNLERIPSVRKEITIDQILNLK